ncbi:MAG: carbamoyltransferase HypF [Candidatus Ranarchaeia archaeon]
MRKLIHVKGIVQGVGFRPYVYKLAKGNFLKGYVLNLGDKGVEIVIEGQKNSIELFIRDLPERIPPLAKIESIKITDLSGKEQYEEFTIIKSKPTTGGSGWVIPSDVSICEDCLRELRDPKDRRYGYYFITCTNCGPRFTTTYRVPYDRISISLRDFEMCEDCKLEYNDPSDRRFHAQTIACNKCGPKLLLRNQDGVILDSEDPIQEIADRLLNGEIAAIKGIGGYHIACLVDNIKAITRIRNYKKRSEKPFAIMVQDIEKVKEFSLINKELIDLLKSQIRPIVLLPKKEDLQWMDYASPGLNTIGVMLPYTGLHYLLLEKLGLDLPALVMTSGNIASEPIISDDKEAFSKLKGLVNVFLSHEREITQKADDSVIRWTDNAPTLIRRSRGYVPNSIMINQLNHRSVVALGGDINVTICILNKQRAFISQHLGDLSNLKTSEYAKKITKYMMAIARTEVDAIICDLHPQFPTTEFGYELSEELDKPLIQIQHHESHSGSLFGEHNLTNILSICSDGFGLGSDGKAWGGEVFNCNKTLIKRIGHLQPQPLIGGDLATRFPMRMVAGILRNKSEVNDWINQNSSALPYGTRESEIIIHEATKFKDLPLGTKSSEIKKGMWTTSTGRILDAIAVILDVCHERTYEGEPAMKLESCSSNGKNILTFDPIIKNNILNTEDLVQWVFDNKDRYRGGDIAYSAQTYLGNGLAEIAINNADRSKADAIGFTGGVAFNEIISRAIRTKVEKAGLQFVRNLKVPPGDGGLSFGQAVSSILWKKEYFNK